MITHEFKKIVETYQTIEQTGGKAVLATVVALDGSSYRRPGVRMLILENGTMVGAVSGGCVEKEVFRQAHSVFETNMPKVMTYDGRFRLGCEGILYILLEPFQPSSAVINAFWNLITQRKSFEINSHFEQAYGKSESYGSQLRIGDALFSLRPNYVPDKSIKCFTQGMLPCFRLVLIGGEHDTVQLCSMASLMGWEVSVVANPKDEKRSSDFPGNTTFISADAESLVLDCDEQTAVVLMTHSYVKDLQFLMTLKDKKLAYFGVLGPARRREKLFNELLEQHPETPLEFIESAYGPAGLELGAETPQEIAVSVLSEILAVVNGKKAVSLKEKSGRIHA